MNIFGKLKRSTKKTTEEVFKLPPQPPEICSSIDEIIYEVRGLLELPDEVRVVESLEDLRYQVVSLRAWGQGWKTTAEKILEHADNFIPVDSILEGIAGTNKNPNPL